jgi:hypothetical protein
MSRSLDDLDPKFRPLAEQFVKLCLEKIPDLVIVDTLRTEAEHAANVVTGTSWVKRSKHQDGLAIDVAPASLMKLKFWAPKDPMWWTIAGIAVSLGLRSGMDWKGVGIPPVGVVRAKWDPGHAEMK